MEESNPIERDSDETSHISPSPTSSKAGIFYIIVGVLQLFTAPLFFSWWQNEPQYMGPLTLFLVLTGSSLGFILLGVFRFGSKPNVGLYISAFSILTIIALLVSLNMVGSDMAAMEAADESDDPGFNIIGLIILFIVGPVFLFHVVNSVVLLITYRSLKSEGINKRRISRLALSLIVIPIIILIAFKSTGGLGLVNTDACVLEAEQLQSDRGFSPAEYCLEKTGEYSIILLANIFLVPSGIISLAIVYFQTRPKKQD
jgi:uncharacterized membrane protein